DHAPQGLGILVLPPDERHYHADLVQAADGVLAKVGYSTLAEVYRAGIAHAYIPRAAFRESPPLEAFIQQQMPAIAISESDVAKGDWIRELPALLSPSPRVRDEPNGADVIADYLTQHLLNA
ncbi:MAG: hypothetical protein O3A51_07505, partial [Verrucomicrobia bacterium]|nr:hypothetical protein [Verrucomicrobiota bacterium]